MSGLWTPGGEQPAEQPFDDGAAGQMAEPTEEQMAQQMAELQAQLANTPAEVVIANHCFGLFELAALHLSMPSPQLDQAKLAIDALDGIDKALDGRLGEPEPQLKEGLAQLKLAYVQISQAANAANGIDTEAEA